MTSRCLVSYTAVIWFGYNEALSKISKRESEAEIKLAKLLKSKPDRPDAWVSYDLDKSRRQSGADPRERFILVLILLRFLRLVKPHRGYFHFH